MDEVRAYRSRPRFILSTSLTIRLTICIVIVLLSVILSLLTATYMHGNMIMTLLVALGGWVFGKKEEARQRVEEMERQTRLVSKQQRQLHQIKAQFILNVNHELRTPLAAAYSYFELIQLIMEQHSSLDTATYTMYIKHALRYCEDLRSMVNNVLDTMDLECAHKPLQSKHCLLDQIIDDTCQRIDAVHREQQRIHLTIPSDLTVFANPQYVRDILHQLLTNAIKFSPENSPIVISAHLLPESNEVCISIQDQGPGIPADEIPLLFDQFVRLKRDIAGTVRGSGLGLYICKHLVETMRGRIWIESSGRPNEGSCLHFTLPVNPVNPVGVELVSTCSTRSALTFHPSIPTSSSIQSTIKH